MRMKNCIVCDQPACVTCGHVHTPMGVAGVGICKIHWDDPVQLHFLQGQIIGCTSPNPNSCYGKLNLTEKDVVYDG